MHASSKQLPRHSRSATQDASPRHSFQSVEHGPPLRAQSWQLRQSPVPSQNPVGVPVLVLVVVVGPVVTLVVGPVVTLVVVGPVVMLVVGPTLELPEPPSPLL